MSSANESRLRLEKFLSACSPEALRTEFKEPWLNQVIPGLEKLESVDQGRVIHLEGNVAIHTALVFENMQTVANKRLGRSPDFIELLAAVVHDLEKSSTRFESEPGHVKFPGHEAAAAARVPAIGRELGLTIDETERLFFIVARHGDAHNILCLPADALAELQNSPHRESLALLQEADARSCWLPDGKHNPSYWEQIVV
ncbi:MAG: hypothetical protein KDD62_10970 [Bdellovibrionales bacterium]|nr:hypothetical protein [Bdellovibrionales bacterium]